MSVGLWQILIVVALLLLLFGRGRISQSMADLAKGIRAFRHGLKDEEDVVQTHERDSDSDTQPQKTTPFLEAGDLHEQGNDPKGTTQKTKTTQK